jgi:hypothetical protein
VTQGCSSGKRAQTRQREVALGSGQFGPGDQTFESFVLRWQMVDTASVDRCVKLRQHAPERKQLPGPGAELPQHRGTIDAVVNNPAPVFNLNDAVSAGGRYPCLMYDLTDAGFGFDGCSVAPDRKQLEHLRVAPGKHLGEPTLAD